MFFRFFRRKYNNHSTQKNFSSESPNCASASHAAEFVQGAVPLGITQISWGSIGLCGVLFVSQKNIGFRTLEAIVPDHSFAKILIRSMIIIFTYFPVKILLRMGECLNNFVSSMLAANAAMTRKK